jgi:hypothetical protein
MRILGRAWGLGALIAAGLILSSGTLSAADAPVVHLNASVKDGNVQLQVEANGPFEYTTYRPTSNLYVIDLSGVAAADPAGMHEVASDVVKSYGVVSFVAGDKPVVRVEILLKPGVEPRLLRKGNQNLTVLISHLAGADSSAPSTPFPAAAAMLPSEAKPSEAKDPGASSFKAIQHVRLAENGDATEVSISGSGSLTYHVMHLQNPDRLVIDFSGSHLNTSETHIASQLDPVREIRLGQFTPETSRVVIDLSQPARYSIQGQGETVTVTLKRLP